MPFAVRRYVVKLCWGIGYRKQVSFAVALPALGLEPSPSSILYIPVPLLTFAKVTLNLNLNRQLWIINICKAEKLLNRLLINTSLLLVFAVVGTEDSCDNEEGGGLEVQPLRPQEPLPFPSSRDEAQTHGLLFREIDKNDTNSPHHPVQASLH